MNIHTDFQRAETLEIALAAIIESSDDAIIGKTMDGIVTSWNPGAERMFGWTAREMINASITVIIPPDRQSEGADILSRIARGERLQHFETVRLGKDGRLVDISATISPILSAGGLVVGASKIARDITGRKIAEQELRVAKQQLQALVGKLNNTREEEARRISRDLHDDLGHLLTAVKLELGEMELTLSRATARQKEKISHMHMLMDHTIVAVQQIADNLRLSQLDLFGLAAAIDWQLKEFSRHSSIPCRVTRMDDVPGLSDQQNTGIFRILQETLTNIARHSCATDVEIRLQAWPDHLTLKVRDNGRGICAADVNSKKALGLLGMRERAQLLGGDVTITGAAGLGTTILARIPLGQPAAALQ